MVSKYRNHRCLQITLSGWLTVVVLVLASIALLWATGTSAADDHRSSNLGSGGGGRVNTAAAGSIGQSLDAFSFQLLRRVGGGENLVVSPYSVATTLGMVGAGAAHETARQIERVLHTSSLLQMDGELASLRAQLGQEQSQAGESDPADAAQLAMSSGAWVQSQLAVRPAFDSTLVDDFAAPLQMENFAADPELATSDINGWVANNTGQRLQNILAPGAISTDTRLVVASTIYLAAHWRLPFDPKLTRPESFVTAGGRHAPTEFMRQSGPASRFPYASGPDYRAIDLPYRGSDLSMLVVMPDRNGLASFQRHFNASKLNQVIGGLRERTVDLGMPRFHLNFREGLNAVLAAMGMPNAFHPGVADFSGIAGDPGSLYLSLLMHAADLEVDEQGTIASAASVGIVDTISAPLALRAVRLTLNHPFLYFIRDDATGTILFAGRLADPATE
jgi:serpin B